MHSAGVEDVVAHDKKEGQEEDKWGSLGRQGVFVVWFGGCLARNNG